MSSKIQIIDMLRYFLFFCFVFSFLFYFIPVYKLPLSYALVYAYQYNLENQKQSAALSELTKNNSTPFFAIKDYNQKNELFIKGPGVSNEIQVNKKNLVVVPFLGNGFFQYKKIGKEIQFYSGENEQLWFKEFYSYPASDTTGKNLILLTGDSNRVDFIDPNGNDASIDSVSGNFMVHYFFDHSGQNKVIVFSDGRIAYIHKNQSKLVFEMNSKEELFYVKSCSLSPDGRLFVVHYFQGQKDKIKVFSIQKINNDKNELILNKKEIDEFDLPRVYPHLLHISINEGGVLVATPDQTMYFALDGGANWQKKLDLGSEIYRPVFAGESFFVYGEKSHAKVLNKNGVQMYSIKLDTNNNIWRILPTRSKKAFAIQTKRFIEMWILKNQT